MRIFGDAAGHKQRRDDPPGRYILHIIGLGKAPLYYLGTRECTETTMQSS
jgi:hypothetical protein